MGLIDVILNLAGLLLWLNWRYLRSAPSVSGPQRPLLSTLKRVETPRQNRSVYLAWLLGLLFLRGLIYWYVGGEVDWTPTLNLGPITVSFGPLAATFRNNYQLIGRMQVYSWLSFGVALGIFYVWLLLLSVVNKQLSDSDPFQKAVREQLGWVEHLPFYLKLLLPALIGTLLWIFVTLGLGKLGLMPAYPLNALAWQKGFIASLFAYLTWKALIAGGLLLYFLNSYVYLGHFPFWAFANHTARNLLSPLKWLPLRLGRIDLTPIVMSALILGLARLAANGLIWIYTNRS